MSIESYKQYWGKADEPLKVAYCSGEDRQAIFDTFKKKIAYKQKKTATTVKLIDLDAIATKANWHYAQADYAAYHCLPYHCLDVTAVADAWWQHSQSIRDRFIQATGLSTEHTRAWVLFFIALHDFGKLDIRFQMKVPHLAPYTDNKTAVDCKEYYHGEQGYYWYYREAAEYGLGLIEEYGEIEGVKGELWMAATGGHHGTIPLSIDDNTPAFVADKIKKQDQQARKQWLNDLADLFLHPVGLTLDDIPDTDAPILLAGFCSVCDWLGSNQDYFKASADRSISLADYFAAKQSVAAQILQDFGLLSAVKTTGGMAALYDFVPRNIQTRIDDLAVEPSLVIIEANTGSGKTEAALAFASRLLANNLADNITFALPSQATANAMLARLELAATKIFKDNSQLILAHGKSQSNPRFQALIQQSKQFQPAQGDQEASVQCSEWLASSRKRAFLGQIAVSTVDQVMLSAIKSLQHYFVRIFGVGKGVLIIDEVHAYDAYMYAILQVVISQQKQAGGSVILLSATLPSHQKQALISAWGVDEAISTTAYPLMLQATQNKLKNFMLSSEQQLQARSVAIELIANDELRIDEALLQRIVAAAKAGAKVGIVCNLVHDAQRYASILSKMTELPVDLFHSRYRFCDRMDKEQQVLNHYDAKSPRVERILVGTQVIEQSLDIDFDWLISFICPIDLLFQRMGRLHRHEERVRIDGFKQPLCSIVVPNSIDLTTKKSTADCYALHGFIYKNIRVLWRTQQLLLNTDKIEFPFAYRDWIEAVYQQDPWESQQLERGDNTQFKLAEEPESIQELAEDYAEDQFASRCVAKGFTKEKTFFQDTEGNAALLTREGELNLSVIPVIEKAGKHYLLDGITPVPSATDKYNRETLSQNSLAVPSSRAWQALLPEHKEGIYYLVMQEAEQGWEYQHQQGHLVYTLDIGLEKLEKE